MKNIEKDRFPLQQASYLVRKFRLAATAELSDERKNDYFAGYAESFLTRLAASYPEVREAIEERVLYNEFHKR